MGSADNLNLDCLEFIFAYLSGQDLFSVSLVSRSFLAGVVPRLYRALVCHLGNAKRYPSVSTAFDAVNKHPNLAVHVQHIDIRTIPALRSAHHPKFIQSCNTAISRCTNLRSFTCTPNMLSSFLLSLESLNNLEDLRVNATLTVQQDKHLTSLTNLRSLSLDACTWNVVDALPSWTNRIQGSLTSLTLYTVQELNDQILHSVLQNLPNLTALHVVGCSKIEHVTVLQCTSHTPRLESLSLTAWESGPLPQGLPTLSHLRHLAIDTHVTCMGMGGVPPPTTPALWRSMIEHTREWLSPISSLTLRLVENVPISYSFIADIVDTHGSTLTQIAMLDCGVGVDSVRAIATRCLELERLAVHIPSKDVFPFSTALSHSKTLQTLTDVSDAHTTHGMHRTLTRDNVRTIMEMVPKLTKLTSDGRVWTCDKRAGWGDAGFKLKLQKRKNMCPSYWFLPPWA